MSQAMSSRGLNSSSDLSYQFSLCQLGISVILNCLLARRCPSLGNRFPWLEICYKLSLPVTCSPHFAVCPGQEVSLEIYYFLYDDSDPGEQVIFPSQSWLGTVLCP